MITERIQPPTHELVPSSKQDQGSNAAKGVLTKDGITLDKEKKEKHEKSQSDVEQETLAAKVTLEKTTDSRPQLTAEEKERLGIHSLDIMA